MRDELVEVLVKCKTNIGLKALQVLAYVLCGVCVLGSMVGFGMVALLFAIVFGIAGYLSGMYSKVEYEYTYCNKEMDVDVIYSQIKRKHKTTFDLTKMEALVRVNSDKMKEFERREFKVMKYHTGRKENEDKVYALIYDGTTKVLMEPDERLLEAINYMFPRKVFN